MNKPTYSDSLGNRYTTDQIEKKIKKAALEVLDMQFLEHGYNFCTVCKRNDCKPIDVSHDYSRKKAKEDGCVEVLWAHDNLKITGRDCHKVKDGLNLQYSHED
ncbi:MAG: hypothetical protein AAFY00_10500 [Bacteroidota bacterium]